MLGQQNTLDFTHNSATPLPALVPSTQKTVEALKNAGQDFEWFPTLSMTFRTFDNFLDFL